MKRVSWKLFRISFIFTAVLFSLPHMGFAQAPPQKYALLIGLDHYFSKINGVSELKYAVADIDSIEKILKSYGFQVTSLRNQGAKRDDIVMELIRCAYEVKENDIFLLYYSGHGLRNQVINNKTYWLTYNAMPNCIDLYGIRFEHLLDYIQDIKARIKLVLLDHCFSGDIIDIPAAIPADTRSGSGSNISSNPMEGAIVKNVVPIQELKQSIENRAKGMIIMAAARNEALESEKLGHGVFSYSVITALQSREADLNNDAKLSIDEFKSFLRIQVPKVANQIAPGFQQDFTEATSGIDLTGLILVDKLPLSSLQEAQDRANKYIALIDNWSEKCWLDYSAKIKAKEVLEKWIQYSKNNMTLDDHTRRLLDYITTALEAANLPENIRAGDLNKYLINHLNP